jgi:hypothetical protein
MQIHEDQRVPAAQLGHQAADFGLGQQDPVAVEIEEVMVASSAGPRFDVLGRGRMFVRARSHGLFEVADEALAPSGFCEGIRSTSTLSRICSTSGSLRAASRW